MIRSLGGQKRAFLVANFLTFSFVSFVFTPLPVLRDAVALNWYKSNLLINATDNLIQINIDKIKINTDKKDTNLD